MSFIFIVAVALLGSLSVLAEINTVTLTQGDGSYANSSFVAAGSWSNGEAPSAPEEGAAVTNHYLVALGPGSENALWIMGIDRGTQTFAGQRLTIGTDETEGALRMSGKWNGKIVIPELVLHSGELLVECNTALQNAGLVESTAANPFRIVALKTGNVTGGVGVPLSGPESSAVKVLRETGSTTWNPITITGGNYLGKVIYDGSDGVLSSGFPSFGSSRSGLRADAIEVCGGAGFFYMFTLSGGHIVLDCAKNGWVVDEAGMWFENRNSSYGTHKPERMQNWYLESKGEVVFVNKTDSCPLEHGFVLVSGALSCSEGTPRLTASTNTLLQIENAYAIPEGTLLRAEENGTIALDAARIPTHQLKLEGGWIHAGCYSYYAGAHSCAANPELCAYLHPGVSSNATAIAHSQAGIGHYVHPRPVASSSAVGTEEVALKNAHFVGGGVKCEIDIKDEVCVSDCFVLDESCTLEGTVKIAATVAIPLANPLSAKGWTLMKVPTSVRTLTAADFDVSNCFFDTDDGTDPDGIYSPAVRIETVDGVQHVVLYRKRSANPTLIFLR
ncbi:MAG: hypothetical protein ACI4X9_06595 [Kiritimatiellia bacterium]